MPWGIWILGVLFLWGCLSIVIVPPAARTVPHRPRRHSFEETFGARIPNGPPPPSRNYVLSPSSFGPSGEVWSYDIFHGSSGEAAGSLIFRASDKEHYAFWELDLPHDPHMPRDGHVFKRRTDALSWLGNPKIQRAAI